MKTSKRFYEVLQPQIAAANKIRRAVRLEDEIAVTHNTSGRTINLLFSCLPEILVSWSFKDAAPSEWIALTENEKGLIATDFNALLLCHSLSPTWDSASLLAELGRCCRVAHVLKKPLYVMLADETWSEYNWVVKDLRLSRNLYPNLEWRRSLYRTVLSGFSSVSVNSTTDELLVLCGETGGGRGRLSEDTFRAIKNRAREYALFCNHFWGEELSSKDRLNDDDVELILKSTRMHLSNQTGEIINIEQLTFLKADFDIHEQLIKTVARDLRRLDQDTFFYFFLQYLHQSQFDKMLKLAVRRERSFDTAFAHLNILDGVDYSSQRAIYFEDYYFLSEKGRSRLTAHPYYFPSGNLYKFYPNPNEARAKYVMLDDYNDKTKLLELLGEAKPLNRARFISDLLSFAHFFVVGADGATSKLFHAFISNISRESALPDIKKSWEYYATDDFQNYGNRVDAWSSYCFTEMCAARELPYFFLPFVWNECGMNLELEARLVAKILQIVSDRIPLPVVSLT